ncbi:MAG: SAM-dependent methyltransferase [Bacteroidia bacterium]|nr:MAG: SAM-dependent methyltransferase [Bacteroidia bacterium]
MNKIIKFLVRKIPRVWLIRFSYLFSWLVVPFYKGEKQHCPICKGNFRKFLPYGNLGIDNRLCPRCLSLERHRLLWLFFERETRLFTDKLKLLHIAPEQSFMRKFKKQKNLDYTTADLESPLADIKLDVTQMPLENDSYDVVICNHVMEHIDDEQKAMKEIFRVLKPEGWAILQVPLDYNRECTYEDPSVTRPEEREAKFGQYDHVRLYGRDYKQRLEKAGFVVNSSDFVKTLGDELVEKYRLDKQELVYRCFKK